MSPVRYVLSGKTAQIDWNKNVKRHYPLRVLGIAGLGSLIAATALAQETGYPYGGLSIGRSRAQIDEPRITANLVSGGLTTTGMTRDDSSTSYKLFGGYQFNRYFALEGGYFHLGRFGFTSTTVPAGTLDGRIKLQGLNLDLVGTLPFSERWSAIGRVGGQYARARDTFSGSGAVQVFAPTPSKSELNYKLGLGLQYEINRSFLVRAEGERYRINDAVGNHGDINVFSVSLVFPFGREPAATPRAMAAPVDVALAPAPAPAPAPAAAPTAAIADAPTTPPPAPVEAPARRKVSFSADSLFTFDESVIRPAGKASLDRFTKDLAGAQFDVVTVEGHSDRLGSQAYNQRLSVRRADAVKAYLVDSGQIDGAKVSANGRGKSAPVTKPNACTGNKATAKLVACLQPDRRVDVEVAGTR
jgi:OmpA-OmpF porin, OOP family